MPLDFNSGIKSIFQAYADSDFTNSILTSFDENALQKIRTHFSIPSEEAVLVIVYWSGAKHSLDAGYVFTSKGMYFSVDKKKYAYLPETEIFIPWEGLEDIATEEDSDYLFRIGSHLLLDMHINTRVPLAVYLKSLKESYLAANSLELVTPTYFNCENEPNEKSIKKIQKQYRLESGEKVYSYLWEAGMFSAKYRLVVTSKGIHWGKAGYLSWETLMKSRIDQGEENHQAIVEDITIDVGYLNDPWEEVASVLIFNQIKELYLQSKGASFETEEAVLNIGAALDEISEGIPADAKPFDVFISHSSADKHIANAACSIFESLGIRCWIAPRDIEYGMTYPEGIMKGIEDTKVLLLIFSKNAATSRYVNAEVERAFSKGHTIIQLRLENHEMNKGLEYLTSSSHWMDALTEPREKQIRELGEVVLKIIKSTDANVAG